MVLPSSSLAKSLFPPVARPATLVKAVRYHRPLCTTSSNGCRSGCWTGASGLGRVAQRDQERAGLVLGKAEQPPRELLIADGRVAAPDAQAGGREHDAHRRLAEVERGATLLVRCRRDQRDGRRGPRHVAGAPPDFGQLGQLLAVGDDDEVPRLPVPRGRGPPGGLQDLVEGGGRDRPAVECPDVAARPDRVPDGHLPAGRRRSRPRSRSARSSPPLDRRSQRPWPCSAISLPWSQVSDQRSRGQLMRRGESGLLLPEQPAYILHVLHGLLNGFHRYLQFLILVLLAGRTIHDPRLKVALSLRRAANSATG